jgi:hypothetical protein
MPSAPIMIYFGVKLIYPTESRLPISPGLAKCSDYS